MPKAQLDDIEIYYELHGEGQPLALIAGHTCDHVFWEPMLEYLTKKFQVLIFDNRGIGQTKDQGKDFTIETMAQDTIALFQKLGLTEPHVVGHSMGGAIAQTVAYQAQDVINKIMIMNSSSKFSKRTLDALEALLNLRKENISLDCLMDVSLPWFFSNTSLSNPEAIATIKYMLKNNPYPQTIIDQERQLKCLQKFDSRSWLNKINSSTLVIASEEDIVTPIIENKKIAEAIPSAKFKTIPEAHSIESPERISQIITEFLEEPAKDVYQ